MAAKRITTALPLPRWHEDLDRWVWRVYEGGVTPKGGEDVRDIYIVPTLSTDEWWIVSAKTLMADNQGDWIQRVQKGEGVRIAGPFADVNDAKAAWRVMYG